MQADRTAEIQTLVSGKINNSKRLRYHGFDEVPMVNTVKSCGNLSRPKTGLHVEQIDQFGIMKSLQTTQKRSFFEMGGWLTEQVISPRWSA